MPIIFYEVPPISIKFKENQQWQQYQQKGPTCWYYAWKMLLKYHQLTDSKCEKTYNDLKALSEVRKIITQMYYESDMKLTTYYQFASPTAKLCIDKLTTQLNIKVMPFQKKYIKFEKHFKELVLEGRKTKQSPTIKQTENLSKLFEGYSSISHRIDHIQSAISKLAKLRGASVGTFSFLEMFFSGELFYPIPYQGSEKSWKKTCDELYDILNEFGPVLTGGSLGFSDIEINVSDPFTEKNVTSFREGGHAILIIGVDTSQKCIYYKDPNRSNLIYRTTETVFFKNIFLNTLKKDTPYITVKCPTPDSEGNERCVHINQSKKALSTTLSKIQKTQNVEFGEFVKYDESLQEKFEPDFGNF